MVVKQQVPHLTNKNEDRSKVIDDHGYSIESFFLTHKEFLKYYIKYNSVRN